jgi:spermidine/putrescine transport system substrate-binding protein
MKATFRLSVSVLSLVLAALPGALRDSGPAVAEDSGQLVVLDWPGYDAEAFWTDFKKKYPDARVTFEIGASDADIYGKIKAGSQADIIHPYTGWLQLYVDEGLVEEIDVTKIANWDKVPENFKKIGNFNGKQYFIPWDWGFSSILYRTDKVKGTIDSWSALLDPQYNRHISMWDDGPSAVAVSAYLHKYDEHKITPEQLADIKSEWIKQRDLNLVYWAGEPELVDAMAVSDVWLAYAWQGAYATLVKKGVPVAYANPKEGRNSWVGVYGIRKGTKNKELALKFINEKLSEATANYVVTEFYYGVANGEVMNSISDPTLKQAFSLDDPSVLERTNYTPELTAEQRDAWTSMWTDVKAAP